MRSYLLLTGLAMLVTPAFAQADQPSLPQTEEAAEEEIVVTAGARPPGSALGNIKPEVTLGAGDIRALGASNVTEILAEIAPQIRGTASRQPLILLDGHRVSGRQEIQRIPSEAIARVDILPEQVALKYGYPADQKVVNFVLRKRFRAWTMEGRQRLGTEGGGARGSGAFDFFSVRNGARITLGAEYTGTDMLTEAQRGLAIVGTDGRSLIASEQQFEMNMGYFRPLSERLSASLSGTLTTDRTRALTGAIGAQTRTISSQTAHLGSTVNRDAGRWRGTWTASYDHGEARTISSRPAAGQPADQAHTNSDVLVSDMSVNGPLIRLPAGDVSVTGRIGGTVNNYDSRSNNGAPASSLSRTSGLGALSLDVPVLDSASPWLGTLSLNGNAQVETLSDYGTVRRFGYGLNWAPMKAVSLVLSYKDAESAPAVQQLGDPQIITSAVRVFDYVRGQTALVQMTSGGNPSLNKASVREWRLGLNVKPFDKPNVTLSLDYTGTRTDNGIVALPALTTASEAAFPGRFTRDSAGVLIAVDARPVNIARQRSDVLRWGVNFSKTLKTPQAQIEAMRAYMAKRFPGGPPGGAVAGQGRGQRAQGPDTSPSAPGSVGTGRNAMGGGRGGGMGGGGRLSLSVYHSIHLTEKATLVAGQPEIDLLNGGALRSGAPQPRHEVEVQAGYARGWIGGRLTANWQSAAHVREPSGVSAGDLRFSSLATFNVRLFANIGQIPSVLRDHPFLFGTRLSMSVNNIFNRRQKVKDGNGITPPTYFPAQLDPLGRTVTISLRKLLF